MDFLYYSDEIIISTYIIPSYQEVPQFYNGTSWFKSSHFHCFDFKFVFQKYPRTILYKSSGIISPISPKSSV